MALRKGKTGDEGGQTDGSWRIDEGGCIDDVECIDGCGQVQASHGCEE